MWNRFIGLALFATLLALIGCARRSAQAPVSLARITAVTKADTAYYTPTEVEAVQQVAAEVGRMYNPPRGLLLPFMSNEKAGLIEWPRFGSSVVVQSPPGEPFQCVRLDEDGRLLLAMSGQQRLSVWSLHGQLIAQQTVPLPNCDQLDVMALAEDRVLVATDKTHYRLLGEGVSVELPRLSNERYAEPGYNLATKLGLVENGRLYLRATEREIWILDVHTGKRLSQIDVGPWRSRLPFKWIEFSDSGKVLAIAAGIGETLVFDAESLALIGKLQARGNIVALSDVSLILETVTPTGATWGAYGLKPFGKKLWSNAGIKALTVRANAVLAAVSDRIATYFEYLSEDEARLDGKWWVETRGAEPLSNRHQEFSVAHFPWILGYDVRTQPNAFVVVDARTGSGSAHIALEQRGRAEWRWTDGGLDMIVGSEVVSWREGEHVRLKQIEASRALHFAFNPWQFLARDGIWDVSPITRHCAFDTDVGAEPWVRESLPKAVLGHRFEDNNGDESYAAWDANDCHLIWHYRLSRSHRTGGISFSQASHWPWLESEAGVMGHLDGNKGRVYLWAPLVTRDGRASFIVTDGHCWGSPIAGLSFKERPSWLPERTCLGLAAEFLESVNDAVQEIGLPR